MNIEFIKGLKSEQWVGSEEEKAPRLRHQEGEVIVTYTNLKEISGTTRRMSVRSRPTKQTEKFLILNMLELRKLKQDPDSSLPFLLENVQKLQSQTLALYQGMLAPLPMLSKTTSLPETK